MIKQETYKGANCLVLENQKIKVVVLPGVGGKIVSFSLKEKKFELLYQNPNTIYKKAKLYDDFSIFDASGFDDCFPSINEEYLTVGERIIHYPDHGELWSGDFDYMLKNDRVYMKFDSKIMSYSFKKDISIEDSSLIINYQIENIGDEIIEGFYTVHCLMNCEEDMILNFPKEISKVVNVLESSYLGENQKVHHFPDTYDLDGQLYHLNRVFAKTANKCEKYYVIDAVREGKCGAYYPSKQVRFEMEYDPQKLPYLGFWITEGGFRGDYNYALEPSNGFYDSISCAKKNNQYMQLKKGEIFNFRLRLSLIC